MRVRILQQFGNHEVGEICDSKRKLIDGRTVDLEMDRKAFEVWIGNGWAEEVGVTASKRIRRPVADKAIE